MTHGNAGRVSNRAKPAEVRKRVLQLVREHYSGEPHERFGPTLAAEHLWTDHDLKLSVRTRRRWMLAAGLWSRRRKRQAHFGELIQVDGSHHQWLEGHGPIRLPDELRRRCEWCGAGPFLKRGNDPGGGRSARSLGAPIRRSQGAVLRLEERLQAASRHCGKRSRASSRRRSWGPCARSWASASSRHRRRQPRAEWSGITAPIKTA